MPSGDYSCKFHCDTLVFSKLYITFAIAFERRIELWCNGNTADFGSVVPGSNPGSSTRKQENFRGSPVFCFKVLKVLNDLKDFKELLLPMPENKTTDSFSRIGCW